MPLLPVRNKWGAVRRERLLLFGGPKVGKALAHGQKVLTPAGWRKVEDIHVGDQVFAHDGTLTEVQGVYPQGLREVCAVTFTDGTQSLCDRDHRWAVQNKKDIDKGNWRVVTTDELMTYDFDQRWYIPVTDPVRYPETVLPIPAYTLGALLGDGGLSQPYVAFTNPEQDIANRLREELPSCQLNEHQPGQYRIVGGHLRATLDQLGLTHKSVDKFIPEVYLRASIKYRIDLLHGLMDTDGTISADGKLASFGTSSYQLALDFKDLVEGLGGVVTLRSKIPTYTHNGVKLQGAEAYTLTFRGPFVPVSSKKHLAKWDSYEGRRRRPTRRIKSVELICEMEATCISVTSPFGLFLTDHHIVTHNSDAVLKLAQWYEITGTPGTFYYLDTDCQLNSITEDSQYYSLNNISPHEISDWDECRAEGHTVFQKASEGDWIVLDMAHRPKVWLDRWYLEHKVGSNDLAQAIVDAKWAGEKYFGANPLLKPDDYTMLRSMWDAFFYPLAQKSKAHIICITEKKGIYSGPGANPEKQRMYDKVGGSPGGESGMDYSLATVLHMDKTSFGRYLTTCGDRSEREWLEQAEYTDLYRSYLQPVAGWKSE